MTQCERGGSVAQCEKDGSVILKIKYSKTTLLCNAEIANLLIAKSEAKAED